MEKDINTPYTNSSFNSSSEQEEFASLICDIKNLLYNEKRFSLTFEPTTDNFVSKEDKKGQEAIDVDMKTTSVESDKADKKPYDILTNVKELEKELKKEALGCVNCRLSSTRTNVVFAYGNIQSPLMLIGEAPGTEEDKQGLPFVGKAGQLLDKMFEAIAIPRKNLYICNIIKCRPPDNRDPKEDEILSCSHFLRKQIELAKPYIIVSLGNFATKYLLDTPSGIMSLRGRLFDKDGIKVLPMLHPAALLYNVKLKRFAWQDLQYLRQILSDGPEYIKEVFSQT